MQPEVTDEEPLGDVRDELLGKLGLAVADIGVTVGRGVVTLGGQVPNAAQQRVAEEIDTRIPGVRAVDDDLEIRALGPHVHDEVHLARALLYALDWNAGVPNDLVKVVVRDGPVFPRRAIVRTARRSGRRVRRLHTEHSPVTRGSKPLPSLHPDPLRFAMHKYVIMGIQGSGKGTQAKLLASDFDLVHISVGDIFRWHIQSHTKLAARIGRFTSAGELVPDEIVDEVVRDRLDLHDWNYGFILDGFPRNRRQAEFFVESYDIDGVIQIDLPDQAVLDRVLNRRLCSRCGLDYNLILHRPAIPDICDVCGGPLVTRTDDTPEALGARLRDYHGKTAPILELFSRKELVVSVDGTKSACDVQEEIRSKIGLIRRGLTTKN
jgi:adenylate kinase